MAAAPVVFDGVLEEVPPGRAPRQPPRSDPGAIGALRGRASAAELNKEEFWAVRDVSFEVHPARRSDHRTERRRQIDHAEAADPHPAPNRGRCAVKGRVGALIEVAAAFIPT